MKIREKGKKYLFTTKRENKRSLTKHYVNSVNKKLPIKKMQINLGELFPKIRSNFIGC